jgi:hypothetical protein
VVVLDIAFAASSGSSVSFEQVTRPFIEELGGRLAAWVDHHDHERHAEFAGDPRFTLATKAEHGACPEMVTVELVRQTGPIDTIVAHHDLDGLYSAAKWIRGGVEPYPAARRRRPLRRHPHRRAGPGRAPHRLARFGPASATTRSSARWCCGCRAACRRGRAERDHRR